MKQKMTRREFVEGAALVAAGTATLGPAAMQAQAGSAAAAIGAPLPVIKEVAMGSVFPYGAVYFRKSNPPAEDWARDHKTAAQIGMNTFRHWVLWGAIEVAPGKFDWSDYDKMMDLAHANGIKVVLAEMTTCAPEWAYRRYAHARYLSADGTAAVSEQGTSTAVSGGPGLCLDNEDARALAEKYLTTLVERYRNHPALLAYDVWNENSYPGGGARNMNCYCGGTKAKLHDWLRQKYGSLESVAKNWGRYSCETWEDVNPPHSIGPYAESLDWLEFRIDDAFRLLKWRVDLIRRLDPKHLVVAHGVAGTLESLPSSTHNEWRSAELVDVWGLTWVASRHGATPWMQFQAMDLARGGARNKPFWHAEAEAGPLWMQPQVIGHQREDGREPDAEDVRIWNLISCACGARGILYPRWRPLLDGPLFGAFGAFGMDGSVTPRAEMAGKVAQWANAHAEVWKSHPVKGDVGLLFVPESENFAYAQQGNTEYYAQSIKGAYQGFFDSNIQADLVALDDIAEYKLVYLPYPVMLKKTTAEKLKAYVRAGGVLVCEGVPAYFGDKGHVGEVQPNFGLDELFGAREKYVEFNPDLSEDTTLEVRGQKVYGRYFRQDYELTGGKAAGQWSNGNIAAVENTTGSGRTLLIGSFPGAGYYRHHGAATRALFTGLLEWAGLKQQVVLDDTTVQARLHMDAAAGADGGHLWITNPTRTAKTVTVTLAGRSIGRAEDLWAGAKISASGSRLTVTVPPRDAVVAKLMPS